MPTHHHRITGVHVHATGARRPEGLKRQVFDLALHGVDLLVGPNGAGKTTRGPLAITAAIEGLATVPTDPRRPYIGRLPEETAVTLDVETPTGSEQVTRDLSVARGKRVAAADQVALDIVGTPPTAWDLRDFASGTDGQRGKILDAVARAGGAIERWDAARAQRHVQDLMEVVTPEGDDRHDLAEAWMAPVRELVRELDTAPDGATWLRSAETFAVEQRARANRRQLDAGGHLQEVTAEVGQLPSTDAGELRDALREVQRREARLDAVGEERTRAQAARRRHKQEGERMRTQLQATQDEGQRLAQPADAPDVSIPQEVHERVRQAEAEVDAPIAPPTDEGDHGVEAATEARDEALAARQAAEQAQVSAQKREEQAREAEATAAEDHQRAADLAAGVRGELRALQAISGQGHATCRHCDGADPLGILVQMEELRAQRTDLEREAEVARQQLGDARTDLEAARTALRDARDEATKARRAWDAAERNLAAARARAEGGGDHAEQIRAARHRELEAARAELAREERRVQQRQEEHRRQEAQREQDLAAARKRWAATKAALDEWEATEPPSVPSKATDEDRSEIQRRRKELEEQLEEHRRHERQVEAVRRAEQRYADLRLAWDATRALVDAVRQARDDMAAAAHAPIDRAARELLEGAGAGLPVPYFSGPDDYGAVVPGRGRVPYAGLSESEQRITASALVYALATVAGCPCRLVLLDGLEVVQRDHRAPLLAALTRAQQAGLVDTVVATMATAPGEGLDDIEAIDGLTIHRIERTASPHAENADEVVQDLQQDQDDSAPTTPQSAAPAGCPF